MADQAPRTIFDAVHDELNQEFFEGIAEIAYFLNLDGEKHNEMFSYAYMKYIYEHVSPKVSDIVANTAYSYHKVSKFLKSHKTQNNQNSNRTKDIFSEFIFKLRSKSLEYPDRQIPKYGKNSVRTVFEESRINDNYFTLPSVITFLTKCKVINESEGYISFLPIEMQDDRRSPQDVIRQFSGNMKRYSSTILRNVNSSNPKGELFERALVFREIDENHIDEAEQIINEELRKAQKNIWERLEEIETPGIEQKYELGAHLFGFNITLKREKS